MARFSGTLVEEQPAAPKGPRFKGTPVQDVQQPAAQAQMAPADFQPIINQAAAKYGLDPRLLSAQIKAESSFNPRAVSPKGARGLMQLMPDTAAELGVADPFDPVQNIEGGAKYMRQLIDKYQGNVNAALHAYNWGMGNVDRQGLEKAPKETRDYVAKIRAGAGDPDVPMPGVAAENTRETYRDNSDLEAQWKALNASGTRGADYNNAAAQLMNEYHRRTGKRPEWSGVADFFRGFGQGMLQDPINAARQVADLRWMVPDKVERQIDRRLGGPGQTVSEKEAAQMKSQEAYRESIGQGGFDTGRLAGAIMNPVAFAAGSAAQLPAWVERLAPRAQAMIKAIYEKGAVRGGVGAMTEPVDPTATGGIPGQKATQAITGAIAGPAAEAVGRGVTKLAGHTAGAWVDRMASEEIERLVQLGRQHGINLLAGDYDQNRKLVRGLEARFLNSQMPGLNIDLEPQQRQAMQAAQKMVNAQSKQMESMTFVSADKIKEIAAGNGKRAAEARAVLKMAEEAGTDARMVIQASGNMKWLRMKLVADRHYDEVEKLAGNADVPPDSTLKVIDDILKQSGDPRSRPIDYSPETINLLRRWKAGLDIAPEEGGDEAVDAAADAAQEVVPNTYMRMRNFLSRIEKRVDDATKPGGQDADTLWLKDVAKAVREDMDAFAESTPMLAAANARANKFYTEHVVPYQSATLAKALKSDNPDDVWGAFVRQGAAWRGDALQQKLYKSLDDKGKAAVRAGILQDAFRQATDPEYFSSTAFNRILRNSGYGSFFAGKSRTELDGLMKLFDHIARSDPKKLAQFQPMMGNIAGISMLGTAGFASGLANPATIAGALAATGALKWLVTSDKGRRLLYSANLLKPGMPQFEKRWQQLLYNAAQEFPGQVGAGASRAAGMEQGQEGTVLP